VSGRGRAFVAELLPQTTTLEPMPEALACLALVWILYLEVCASMRRVQRAVESGNVRGPSHLAGLKVGAASRCFLLLVTGLFALDGSRVGFVLFALLVVMTCVTSGAAVARRFDAGRQNGRPDRSSDLSALAGVAVIAVGRGIPLVLFTNGVRPLWP